MNQAADRLEHVPWQDRWEDPWRGQWAGRLRNALYEGAEALRRMLGLPERSVGMVPAVYFTRLRMASVPFFSWEERTEDVRLAFPWNPGYVPPPFTCFATPFGRSTEAWFGLVARVATLADDFMAGADDQQTADSTSEELHGLRAGIVSWVDEESGMTIADEWMLRTSGVAATTCIFLFPAAPGWMPYVPLLYFQSCERYDIHAAEALIRTALLGSDAPDAATSDAYRDLRRAVSAAAYAAHVRAREWLNAKTQLLNRTGFEGLKEDLRLRIANGVDYAEVFFDIDHFKAANDAYTYDGADLLAANVTDRAVAYVQREVARSYERAAAMRRATFQYEPVAPDSFRALVAHVSGDEFRLFVRVRPPENADSDLEAAPLAFTEGLVHAVRTPPDLVIAPSARNDTLAARHAAALERSSAVPRALTGDSALDRRILAAQPTISVGLALPPHRERSTRTATAGALTSARTLLNAMDITAEIAAGTAKRAGRNGVVAASTLVPALPA